MKMTENIKETSSYNPGACFECTESVEGKPVIIRRLKRCYCPNCWIHHCDFRFRKRLFELGRPEKGSRLPPSLIRPSEHALIYYDGSESGLALLHLIRDAIRANISAVPLASKDAGLKGAGGNEQKILPLPFTFSVLFIYDEMNGGREKCMEKLKTVQAWQSETSLLFDLDFPIMVSSLECSLSSSSSSSRSEVEDAEGNRRSLIWQKIPSQSSHGEEAPCTTTGENEETSGDGMLLNSPAYSFPFNAPLYSLLKSLEKNVKSETSKKDFLQILREKLALRIAKECEAKKIFVPQDQTSMAIKMFSLMSLGRGAQLAEQMGLGTEIEGVKFVRPLMDLSQDDLRDYLLCLREMMTTTSVRKVSALPTHSSSSSQPLLSTDKASEEVGRGGGGGGRRKIKGIQEQVEEFIVDLQHGYAATVPTLTKIGAKLKPQGDVASTTTTPSSDKDNRPSLCSFCERNRSDTDESESLELGLCYGCTNILRDMRDSSSFRTWLEGL